MYKISNVADPDIKTELVSGLLGGLNSFQDETLIKDSELTKAKNIILSVDGIEPRPGILHYGGQESATRVLGGINYYKSDGTRELLRISNTGKLEKKNGAAWSQIGSTTYNTSARANFLQIRDLVFICNGVDYLSYYNGTAITSYTALTTPAGLSVTPQGTTGSTAYSYRVSAFGNGETLAASSVAITNGNATLDGTNFNRLAWAAVSGATGYNVYGRKATGLGETLMTTVYTNGYDDKGTVDPSSTLPPESNNTQGIIAKKLVFALSRIFAAGDPNNPSRLYYSGVGSKVTDFSFAENAGGATDIFKNDGAVIRDILPYQDGVIIWKDNAIYKFKFTSTGEPTVEEITRSFGGIAWRGSRHVENDVIFPAKKDGRLAFYSLGNQENYSASVLRTNELSIKTAPDLENVNTSYIEYAAAFYYNNIYGCAIATESSSVNDRIWCLDTRFGAWTHWDDLNAGFFVTYSATTQTTEKLYFGSEDTGYFEEMFYEERSDNGVAIDVEFATKSFNQKLFNKYKEYYDPVFQFKDVSRSGEIEGDIVLDGAIKSGNFTITAQTTGGGGVGVSMPGFMLMGDAPGSTPATTESSDTVVDLYLAEQARSIKYEFRSSSINTRFKFLSIAHDYQVLELKRLPSSGRFYPN